MTDQPRLRIVHLSSGHYAEDERILYRECSSLSKAGHDVTLVARSGENTVMNGVTIRAIRSDPARRLQRWTGAVWQAYREAVQLKADVYHFHDPELIPIGLWLSLRGRRVIYDAHENLPKTFAFKYYLPSFARTGLGWIAGRVEQLSARRFAGVIAATPTIAKRFSSRNKNTVLVRNFPRPDFASTAPTPWHERLPIVAYVGTVSPERGIRESVRAMALLPKRLGARLAIAGPVSQQLRQQIAELDGFDRTDLLGQLGRRDVAALLSRVRIGLVPLHRMPSFVDALPVKLFEYMSAGVPVIASDFPLWREIIDGCGCGLLVDPSDDRKLARAIEYLLTHSEEAREMGERGRAAVQLRYNWSTEERQLLTFYHSFTPQQREREDIAAYAN